MNFNNHNDMHDEIYIWKVAWPEFFIDCLVTTDTVMFIKYGYFSAEL
jgi:hypothetical protein